MRLPLIPIIALFLVCAPVSIAQTQNKKLAMPGPEGVFVNLGLDLPSSARPSNGVTAYRIERRTAGEKSWRQVADVQAPASLEELRTRISQSMRLIPAPLRVDSIPAEWIWQRMQMRYDSLRVYGSLLPIRLALGVVHLDTEAPRATPLEYRVSRIDDGGKVIASSVSEKMFYPPAIPFAKLNARTSESSEREVKIQWASSAKSPTKVFEVYRRENLLGSFLKISMRGGISKQKDSLQLDLRDRSVYPDRIYQYYLVPMDAYGNVGLPSDTVRLATYNFAYASTATYAKIENLDSTGGLRIRWQLQNPGITRGITVFRSEAWDTGFSAIGHLSPTTSEFIDQTVVPMKDYYYYVEAVGHLGERARSCATMHGLYQSSLMPFPPVHLQAEGTPKGVKLTWTSNEENVKGFYVYRGDASATSFDQVSPFIPAEGSEGTFIDSGNALSPRFTYAYAVRSENTSHRLSHLSDTVYARPGFETSPMVPLGLRATTEGKTVQLVWQDMYSGDASLLGFKVLRRSTGGSGRGSTEFKDLTDSLLSAYRNHYTDTTISSGNVYEYAVQAFNVFGGKSELSDIIQLSIASEIPLPPAGIRASKQSDGILVEWDGVSSSNVTGYRLYRRERGKKEVRLGDFKASINEFNDTRAHEGQLYFYYVTSISTNNAESGPSSEVGTRR